VPKEKNLQTLNHREHREHRESDTHERLIEVSVFSVVQDLELQPGGAAK